LCDPLNLSARARAASTTRSRWAKREPYPRKRERYPRNGAALRACGVFFRVAMSCHMT
jgi:hypothetical protein